MPLRSLFLDLNSYFASCEQLMHPELRGRPVAVVPALVDTTSCIAASYEAKKLGVKTGTRVGDARRMCPGIILITGKHEHYIRIHHEIIAAVDTVIPVHKVCSVDEMECRLLGREREPERAIEIARRVKAAIRERVAGGEPGVLTCSIGLAPNRILAKVASDMQKPDGLIVLREEELPHRLASLTLRDLPGIGPRMEIRLKDRGVRTMADLIDRTPEELVNIFGSVHGEWWWHWLRGHDPEQREHGTHSIGHQHVLPPKHRNLADARAIIIRLLHKAAARMRQKGYLSPTMCVFVRTMNEGPGGGRGWGGKSSWERTLKLGLPTDDTLAFIDAFAAAWKTAESDLAAARLLMVGITLVDLVPAAGATLPLFGQSRPRQKLGAVMDKINTTYGKGTLYPASMHVAKDTAPVRIAFHSIPDLDLPA